MVDEVDPSINGDEKGSLSPDVNNLDKSLEAGDVLSLNSRRDRVHFSLWTTLGINFSVTATPITIGASLALSIGVGGSTGYFYTYILATVMQMTLCLSLAEIASSFPHSSGKYLLHKIWSMVLKFLRLYSGQIYWTRLLGPPSISRQLSYVSSWLTSAAWLFNLASTLLFMAQIVLAMVEICFPSFVGKPWHAYLIYIAFSLVSLAVNLPMFFKAYPVLAGAAIPVINVTSLFLMVSLLARAEPKQSASEVFTQFVNETGWKSNGVVFFLGLLPGITCVGGFDASTHVTDELSDPKKQVPQVMIGSALLSLISGFIMLFVYLFCNTMPENLLAPVGEQPLIQLLLDAHRSKALTIVGSILIVVSFWLACNGILTTLSRVVWSIARAGSVPFSATMSKLGSRFQIPINSLFVCTGLSIALGAIQIGSSTALNAILGSANICILLSYMMPILFLVMKGRQILPKDRYINLGKFGLPLNIFAVFWSIFITIWLCFPLYLPVTTTNMNYACAVAGAVVLLSAGNWFIYSKYRQQEDFQY